MKNITNQHTQPATTDYHYFTPLNQVTRPTVPTAAAAHHLNRRPPTANIDGMGLPGKWSDSSN